MGRALVLRTIFLTHISIIHRSLSCLYDKKQKTVTITLYFHNFKQLLDSDHAVLVANNNGCALANDQIQKT